MADSDFARSLFTNNPGAGGGATFDSGIARNFFGIEPQNKAAADGSDAVRGVKVALGQTPALLKGVVGLAGATAENALGEGGLSTGVKNWGLRGYQEGMAKLQPLQKDNDSLSTAWEKATQGDLGALVDFAAYGLGYSVGQLGESAAAAILGGVAGGAVAGPVGAAGGAVEGVVAKGVVKELAKSLIEKQVAARMAEGATRQAATKAVAARIGSNAGLGLFAFTQEAGSIYPEAEEQAAKEGRKLDGADLARVWGSSIAAAGVESLTDRLGLDVMRGKLKIPGVPGRAGSAVIGAGLGAGLEGATEAVQTGIERFGAGKSLTDAEAIKDYVDSAGLGALGGGAIGGVVGAVQGPGNAAEAARLRAERAKNEQTQAETVTKILAAPDVDTAIKEATSSVQAALDRLNTPEYEAEQRARLEAMQEQLDPHMDALTQANQTSDQGGRQRLMDDAQAAAAALTQPGPQQPGGAVPALGEGRSQAISTPHVDRPPAVYGMGDTQPLSVQRLPADRAPANAEPWVDLAPMSAAQARARLGVLRSELQTTGGDPASLVAVQHPGQKMAPDGRGPAFAIKSLDRPAPPVAVAGPGEIGATKRGWNETEIARPDPVARVIEQMRGVNTPAAQATVRDFESGRIDREEVLRRAATMQLTSDVGRTAATRHGLLPAGNSPTGDTRPQSAALTHEVGMSWASQTTGQGDTRNPNLRKPLPETTPPTITTTAPAPPPGVPTAPKGPRDPQNPELGAAVQAAIGKKGGAAVTAIRGILKVLAKSQNPVIAYLGEHLGKGIDPLYHVIPWPAQNYSRTGLYGFHTRLPVGNLGFQPRVPERGLEGHEDSEHTVAHELLHALTVNNYHRPQTAEHRQAKTELQVLARRAKSLLGDERDPQTGYPWYGTAGDNIDTLSKEFIAEAFTNKAFQDRLAQVEYGNQSLWTKFIKTIAKLLGLDKPSMLTEALRLGEALSSTPTQRPRPDQLAKGKNRARTLPTEYSAADEQTTAQRSGLRGERGIRSPEALAEDQTAYLAPNGQDRPGDGEGMVGTSPAAGDAVRGDAPGPALRRRVAGLGIAAEIERTGRAALVGREVTGPKDLAELAQVYRDPRMETFRVFFVKGSTIVHATGVSSRSVGQVGIVPAGSSAQEFYAHMKAMMASTGADSYYLLHNHPSGSPQASTADLEMTREFARAVPGMLAHVIVNSNKFGVITQPAAAFGDDAVRDEEVIHYMGPDKLLMASKPHAVLGRAINGPDDLAMVGKSVQQEGYVTLLTVDNRNQVRGIIEVPSSALNKPPRYVMALARRYKRLSGGEVMFAVGSDSDMATKAIQFGVASGVLTDALGESGQSVVYQRSAEGRGRIKAPNTTPASRELEAPDPLANDYAALEGRKVDQQVKIEDTGQVATITSDAAATLRDYDQRISAMRRLVECLA